MCSLRYGIDPAEKEHDSSIHHRLMSRAAENKKKYFEMIGNAKLLEMEMGKQPGRGQMAGKKTLRVAGLVVGILLLMFSAAAFPIAYAQYTYDSLGRLIKVTYGDANAAHATTVTYTYDAAGNRRVVSSSRS